MSDAWEQPNFKSLWLKYGPGDSPANYIHRFPTLSDSEVAENLRLDLEKKWEDYPDELTENERHEIINKLIVGLLFE